ncbi:MAG: hypothetical protein ACYC91_18495 [Solirubrobacteraceae bacterium]
MNVLRVFKTLHLEAGMKLHAYQYRTGGNGNSAVWAMNADSAFPEPSQCQEFSEDFLRSPRPTGALAHYMDAISGDRTPRSFLEASLFMREAAEIGALWHGVSWGANALVTDDPWTGGLTPRIGGPLSPPEAWDWVDEKPNDWRPVVTLATKQAIVTFYTHTPVGSEVLVRHQDTFSVGSYKRQTESKVIARGGAGLIF